MQNAMNAIIERMAVVTHNAVEMNGGFKGGRLCFLYSICIRMLKDKAQIARKSIKTPESFQGP